MSLIAMQKMHQSSAVALIMPSFFLPCSSQTNPVGSHSLSPHIAVIVIISTTALMILVIVRVASVSITLRLGLLPTTPARRALRAPVVVTLRLTIGLKALLRLVRVGMRLLLWLRCCRWRRCLLSLLLLHFVSSLPARGMEDLPVDIADTA